MDIQELNELIRKRRSVFPNMYAGTPIDKTAIETILENANWAPSHRLTEPWRFRVIKGKGLERLSEFLSNFYKIHTADADFSEKKYEKTKRKPLQCACVIAICMFRDPGARVPEWEEIAAVACAVQNMWLTASALGIGAYWSSPSAIHMASDFLELEDGEKCLGFFYMGNYEGPEVPGKRGSVEAKIKWLE
jgi:nitroreductase